METKTPDTNASETEMESPRKPNSTKCRNGEKIHEDEDSWISGEELYTEESTDDDDTKLSAELREMRRVNKERRKMKNKELASRKDEPLHSGKRMAATAVVIEEHKVLNEINHFDGVVNEDSKVLNASDYSDGVGNDFQREQLEDEEETALIWRPKRGSIKLPALENYREKRNAEQNHVK